VKLALLAWVLIAIGVPAPAQDYAQFSKQCYGGGGPDQTIIACSAVIAAGLAEKDDLAAAFKSRGSAYDAKRQYEKAIEDYDRAVAINPTDADTFNNRGTSQRSLGHYDLAIADFDKATAINPSNASALSNRCFAKAVAGQAEQALDDCDLSLRLRPKDADALASRGFTYVKLGRYAEAIADYTEEAAISPGNAYSLYGRGIAKRMTGDAPGGDADIAAAVVINAHIADEMAKFDIRP
jgi:tetratricopeptide (TPR) repeat protein